MNTTLKTALVNFHTARGIDARANAFDTLVAAWTEVLDMPLISDVPAVRDVFDRWLAENAPAKGDRVRMNRTSAKRTGKIVGIERGMGCVWVSMDDGGVENVHLLDLDWKV